VVATPTHRPSTVVHKPTPVYVPTRAEELEGEIEKVVEKLTDVEQKISDMLGKNRARDIDTIRQMELQPLNDRKKRLLSELEACTRSD